MKSEEVQSLTVSKLQEGKDYPEINKEIARLKKSQIIFKEQKSELTKLRELTIKQDIEIKELKNKAFKLGLQAEANKDEHRAVLKENGDGQITQLRRIMLIMNEEKGKELCLSDIKEQCILEPKKLLSCLGFLEDYNLIKMKKDCKGIQRWSL